LLLRDEVFLVGDTFWEVSSLHIKPEIGNLSPILTAGLVGLKFLLLHLTIDLQQFVWLLVCRFKLLARLSLFILLTRSVSLILLLFSLVGKELMSLLRLGIDFCFVAAGTLLIDHLQSCFGLLLHQLVDDIRQIVVIFGMGRSHEIFVPAILATIFQRMERGSSHDGFNGGVPMELSRPGFAEIVHSFRWSSQLF
jgi:hypothetical protein